MNLQFEDPKEASQFHLSNYSCGNTTKMINDKGLYRIAWVVKGKAKFLVDTVPYEVTENQVIFFTPHNKVEAYTETEDILTLAFDKEFYCIDNHDHEVSCYGYLFYGSADVPIITLNDKEADSFEALFKVFKEEFEQKDHIQGEMLKMLLKRLLIKSARLTRTLLINPEIKTSQLDIVRQFNVLVEKNFREKHQVKDYADLLFKSPKTLSNLFAQYNNQSPLQVINDRITLEAKRNFMYTDKTVEEVTYELGYSDPAHFSKFFKKQTGSSPKDFKSEHKK